MTNYAFKNALIDEKIGVDTSWPCLNEAIRIKKSNKIVPNSLDESQTRSVDKRLNLVLLCRSSEPLASNTTSYIADSANKIITEEFPNLCKTPCGKKNFSGPRRNINLCKSNVLPSSSQKNNFRTPLSKNCRYKNGVVNIPLLSLVKIPYVKKKLPLKRTDLPHNILCGNKLDRDQPVRRKGKVRLHKKKYESKIKKEIRLSRKINKKKIVFNHNILKTKCLIPKFMNHQTESSTDKLIELLSLISIEDKNDTESANLKKENSSVGFSPESEYERTIIFAKHILHSHVFREYCTNIVNSSLLESVESLIVKLRSFQDRLYAKDPVKAFAKRRYLCGFKESKRFLLADKVKLIIVATNLQIDLDLPSGRALKEITKLAEEKEIPVVFAGRGNQIGYWTLKRRRISIVSILNFDGAEESFHSVIKNWEQCSKIYIATLEEIKKFLSKEGLSEDADITKKIEEEIRETILSKLLLENGDNENINKNSVN